MFYKANFRFEFSLHSVCCTQCHHHSDTYAESHNGSSSSFSRHSLVPLHNRHLWQHVCHAACKLAPQAGTVDPTSRTCFLRGGGKRFDNCIKQLILVNVVEVCVESFERSAFSFSPHDRPSWGLAPHGLPGALVAWLAVSTLVECVYLHMRPSDLI